MRKHRKLKTIAKWINSVHGRKYKATVEPSWSNTDTKIAGTRLRRPGKGRNGFCLKIVEIETNYLLFMHDSSETYRNNQEVEEWIKRNIK